MKTLLIKQISFTTDIITYPVPISILVRAGGILNPLFSIPLQFILDLVTSYNLLLLFNIILAGYGAYLLVYYLSKDRQGAFIGGLIYILGKDFLFGITQGLLDLWSAGLLPLYILYLLKASEFPNKKYVISAAILLLLATFAYYVFACFLLIFTAAYLVYVILTKKNVFEKACVRKVVLAITFLILGLFLILIIPYVAALISAFKTVHFLHFLNLNTTHPIDIFFNRLALPLPLQRMLQTSVDVASFLPGKHSMQYYVFVIGFLLMFTLKKKPTFWIYICVIFIVLGLGPYLKVNGFFIRLPSGNPVGMPFILLHNFIPFYSRFHIPDRYMIMATLALAVIVSYVINEKFPRTGIARVIIFMVTIAFVFFAMLISPSIKKNGFSVVTLHKVDVPECYYHIAKEKEGALIEFLANNSIDVFPRYYFQTIHQKPIFPIRKEGPPYFLPAKKFIKDNPFLLYLFSFVNDVSSQPYDEVAIKGNISALVKKGFKYLLLHRDAVVDTRGKRFISDELTRFLGEPEVFSRGTILLYRLS